MRHTFLTPLIVLVMCARATAGQELYDLSEREPEVGMTVETRTTTKGEKGVIRYLFDGVPVEGAIAIDESKTETRTVLKMADGVITEYSTRITESTKTSDLNIAGEQKRETESSPLLNHEVTWTLIDGTYIPELPDATEEQLEKMDPEPYSDVRQYPDEPVAVGHTWELDAQAVAGLVGEELTDQTEGSAVFEFVGLDNYKGVRCAKIKARLTFKQDLDQEDLEEGMDSGWAQISMEGYLYRSLEHRLDVGGMLEGTVSYQTSGKMDGMEVTMGYTIPIKLTGTDRLVRERAEPAP